MNRAILASATLLFLFPVANADAAVLKGAAADAFIQKYFPNAVIPGPVGGRFVYVDKRGRHHRGHARCSVPAMGARSEGEVSRCYVTY
jgi:hypothetical protein